MNLTTDNSLAESVKEKDAFQGFGESPPSIATFLTGKVE